MEGEDGSTEPSSWDEFGRIRSKPLGIMRPVKVRANDVRIPAAARRAVARHEEVVVESHGRPTFVIVHPDDRRGGPRRRGRPLREVLAMLAVAPLPDPVFADDLEAVRASVGPVPPDPWELS
jgi:hypothetical protein